MPSDAPLAVPKLPDEYALIGMTSSRTRSFGRA